MNDKIEAQPENYAKVLGKKLLTWCKDNFWVLLWSVLVSTMLYSMLTSMYRKKEELQEIARQNIQCIYLESSDLGSGQHYMLCDGQIVIRRLSDQTTEIDSEEVLEKTIPTEPTKDKK